MRKSGMLMPVSALPGAYGIGCFSKEAYEFVDILKEAGQKLWQILPLGQTGYGDSPYQSFSTFAGNPYFIDLETLIEDELLTKEECDQADFGENEEEIDGQVSVIDFLVQMTGGVGFEQMEADDRQGCYSAQSVQ